MNLTKSITYLLCALLIASCNVSKTGTQTSNGGSSGSSTRTRWATSVFPLDVRISDALISGELSSLADPMASITALQNEWDDQVSYNFFVDTLQTTPNIDNVALSTYRDSVYGIYKSTSWFSNVTANAIAITQWYGFNTSDNLGVYTQIIHADVIVNARDWSYKTVNDTSTNYFIQQVILHELGHLLGLNHLSPPSGSDAVMKPYMDTDEALDHLQQTDIDGIVSLYSNLSLSAGDGVRALGAGGKPRVPSEDEIIRGVIELHADGQCIHKVNDEVVFTHRHPLSEDLIKKFKR